MNHNIIKQVVQYCDICVDRDIRNNIIMKKVGAGGLYYCRIAKYANLCRTEKGLHSADGLPCYECLEIIYEREACISMAKSHGKKYLHKGCAEKLNII